MSWMLVFPHTPHALVVMKLRRAPGGTVTPAARVKEVYHEGKASKYIRAAEILTAAGAVLAGTSGRSRTRAALGGTALLLGSALTRFGIFEAGINSAQYPRYTVVPQRERAASRS